jgi:hypothetical protein
MNLHQINRRFQYIGEGISRYVYGINDNFVIKIAKGEEGLYQNRVEHYVFTHCSKNHRKYLCPILWYRPKMIVMQRAIPLETFIKEKYIDINKIRPENSAYHDLNQLAKDFYLFYEDIKSTSSWGIISNMPVLIDYGCTSEAGDRYYDKLFYK